ncbi:hypothetical protein CEP51_007962 [Fusarium floridanum]|uniref:CBM-cenC domain-containing protein n=1 Tax=Fusarium floridanum TaxID=1325733 RepID=A0A428RMG1_9HYPO|nr:hypothetical protein CEP51_007962 [Fusarium floridanum]
MIFSKVFIAITALAVSGSVNASPCRPSSGASSSTLLSTTTVSASTESTASTTAESSTTATETATTTESSTVAESTSTGASTTELSTTTAETSSVETSTTIEVSLTTAETSTTAEASSTTAETSTTIQTSSTTAEASTSTASVCVEPTNYVRNPSFEDGDEPWRYSSTVARELTYNGDGDYTLSISLVEVGDVQYAEQDIQGLTPGLEYKMTYQWWTPFLSTPNGCYFYAQAFDTEYSDASPVPSPSDYFVDGPSFTFKPISSTQTINLGVFCDSDAVWSLNIDSVVILPVQPVCSQND